MNSLEPVLVDGKMASGHGATASNPFRVPFASIAVYRDCVVIDDAFPPRIYEFKKENISKVEVTIGFLSGELRLIHEILDYPKYVVFQTAEIDTLLEAFKEFGYNVSQTKGGFGIMQNLSVSLIVPLCGAALSLGLSLLMWSRALPFLKRDRVLSGGQIVSASKFTREATAFFLLAASVFILLGLVIGAVKFWRSRFAEESGQCKK